MPKKIPQLTLEAQEGAEFRPNQSIESIVLVEGFNARKDLGDLPALVASIREDGVQQPVVLQEQEDGSLSLICGFRRVTACKELGLATIPALVHPPSKERRAMLVLNLQENVTRQNLNPMEEAEGVKRLLDEGMDKDAISRSLGWSLTMITQRLNLLDLSDPLKDGLRAGKITVRQSTAISQLPLDRHARFIELAESMSVNRLQELVEQELLKINATANPAPAAPEVAPEEQPDDDEARAGTFDAVSLTRDIIDFGSDLCTAIVEDHEDEASVRGQMLVGLRSIDWTAMSGEDLNTLRGILDQLTDIEQCKGRTAERNVDVPLNDEIAAQVFVVEEQEDREEDSDIEDIEEVEEAQITELPALPEPEPEPEPESEPKKGKKGKKAQKAEEVEKQPLHTVFVTKVPRANAKKKLVRAALIEDGATTHEQADDLMANVSIEEAIVVKEGVDLQEAKRLVKRYEDLDADAQFNEDE